ncbi:hypothetical protein PsorP6_011648 [Peronosclerospora sorghi]|uniref:Uncharacterized protein n=1 Tax=Peronosclerospora sorghi TaxID=230839 RepID=A0ACC0WJ75_9STRA|nr:hypothetical protein PsorP6_011648 [Peronosclerospora sorghi]
MLARKFTLSWLPNSSKFDRGFGKWVVHPRRGEDTGYSAAITPVTHVRKWIKPEYDLAYAKA